MAYKSQVSQKWFGSTDKGKVALLDPRKTEMSQIVSALRNDFTPAMNKFSEKYIEDKQTTASARMTELYASGMKTEDIENAILEGFEPDLSNQYVQIVVDKHQGRFEAAETKRKIEAAKDDYNYKDTDTTIEDHFKKYLPNFDGQSKEFVQGFASVFNEWAADEKVKDAMLRAEWAHEKKIMNGVKFLDSFAKQDMTTYWDNVKTLNTQMPNVDGQKAFYFDTDEMNEVAMAHAEWILDMAEKSEDIAVAMEILTSDRGVGAGGNKLGSLISTRDPAVGDLYQRLELREAQLIAKERRDEIYNKDKDVEAIWAEAFEQVPVSSTAEMKGADSVMRNKNIVELNEIQEKLKQFNDPQLIVTFQSFFSEDRTINNDPYVTNSFMLEIAEGSFGTYDEMIKEMTARGIPSSQLATANARWTTYMTNKDKGTKPVYNTEVVFTNNMTKIEASVLQSFSDPVSGITTEGGKEAVFNASNYMKTEILSFEARFEAENNRLPTWEERRKFMKDLGEHVIEIFRSEKIPEPEGLITMEQKAKDEADYEQLRKDLKVDEGIKKVAENIKDLGEITLPEGDFSWFGDDTTWGFDSADKKEFFEKEIVPAVTKYLEQVFEGVELNKDFIEKGLTQDELDTMVADLAKTFKVSVTAITKIIGQMTGIEE